MNKLLFGGLILFGLIACTGGTDQAAGTDEAAVDTSAAAAPAEAPPAEFADPKYMEMGKTMQAKFESGDIDGWLSAYADNAVYTWSAGDSLAGKEAITKYWKNRFATALTSLKFSNQIWLPVKVNKPQATEDAGTWLLSWYQVDAKYKNGKALTFWAHMVHHFNANDQIDQSVAYIDRAPIVATGN